MDVFDAYFRRADLDQDGKISGPEAVAFLQGSNLPRHVLAQIWTHANQKQTGFLGRPEFYNALKLVTVAQSGRELTQDMVKAALYGPAAAKIPAPQINPVPASSSQMNSMATPPPQLNTMTPQPNQMGAMGPNAFQNFGTRAQQILPNAGTNQQFSPSLNSNLMRPPQGTPRAASIPMQGVGQGPAAGSAMVGPHLQGSNTPNLSTDWFGGRTSGASVAVTSQASVGFVLPLANQDGFGLAQLGATSGVTPKPQTPSVSTSSAVAKPVDLLLSSSQPTDKDSRVPSGNGFSSDSVFGGSAFSANPQAKQEALMTVLSTTSMLTGSQNSIKTGQGDTLQSTLSLPPAGSQLQSTQSPVKQNQLDTVQRTSASTVRNTSIGPVTSASGQAQLQWPRITPSNIQKYTAVFVKVDKDKDGKITGEEARNLFLSWRLPREVLKQVWDLSDQDNDSMLSLREFCTALYLMERFREGCPLPAILPDGLKLDETLLLSTSQPSTGYNTSSWQQNPGLTHQGVTGSRFAMPATQINTSVQAPISSQTEERVQPHQQKSKVPVLEKNLLNQLSKEEQTALNSKFQEATDADKKVQELEKEILDSKEKIEFYHTKMQELVLYKSRCDNRLNEISERVSADKREVESLGRKYEEKYKQVGDVASKLTLDEATFRDIQEKKLELYNAIAKMEQGGTADGVLQVRADRIQSDLEDTVKALNERCKQYGLRAKPTSLIELPFGWQPGIQEGAADWDEDWDKFNDEGFAIIKELTIEVENILAKPKPPLIRNKQTSTDEVSAVPSSSNDDEANIEKPCSTGDQITEDESAYARSEDVAAKSPPSSPRRSTLESTSQEFQSTQVGLHDVSPRAYESDYGGAESTLSGVKYSDEPSWGAKFDSNDDAESIWGFSTKSAKETDHEEHLHDSFFGAGEFGLNPIRTGSPSAGSVFGEKRSPFFDSVPSTPLYNTGSSPRFNEGPEDHAFDRFSRFDSFSTNEGGIFPPRESTFSRFDSMRSTAESPRSFARFDSMRSTAEPPGSFGMFDSMRSTADPSPLGSLGRFDSMRSTTDPPLGSLARFDSIRSTSDYGHGFPSFDDPDPFGSTGPFKSSESHTPNRGTDSWNAF